MSKKIDLNNAAKELFKTYPDKVRLYITTDGQGFFSKNHAVNHAAKNKIEVKEFFREGYQEETDTEIEDALVAAEEKLLNEAATIDTIQDIANVEAEDEVEVPEDAPEAVKAVVELRDKYNEAVANAAQGAEAINDYNALVSELSTLVKDDKTKLAAEIVKLLPVITEE